MLPDIHTIDERMISVNVGHTIYTQLWGSQTATTTILWLHGGPGGSCSDGNKALFEPATQQVLFFDQRGCGRSTPYGSIEHNTTESLLSDITTILDTYDIESAVLVGGSWGSTLALLYALRFPKRVKSMVLRGIFTARESEIHWIFKGRFESFFPENWRRFIESVPADKRSDPITYHAQHIFSNDIELQKKSAFAAEQLERGLLRIDDRPIPADFETFDPHPAIIEWYYLTNTCFLEDKYILDHANELTMPIAIIHGRYDMVCPPITAYQLHQLVPSSQLHLTIAGHSGSDRANWDGTKLLLAQIQ